MDRQDRENPVICSVNIKCRKLRHGIASVGCFFIFLTVFTLSCFWWRIKELDTTTVQNKKISMVVIKPGLASQRVPYEIPLTFNSKKRSDIRQQEEEMSCDYWAVTSSFSSVVSSLVISVASQNETCVVIVSCDETIKLDNFVKSVPNKVKHKIYFLSYHEQAHLYPALSDVIPWKHVARRNIGYIFAIRNGAKSIIEFDDIDITVDNLQKPTASYVTMCSAPRNTSMFDPDIYLQNTSHYDSKTVLCNYDGPLFFGVVQSLFGKFAWYSVDSLPEGIGHDVTLVVPKETYSEFSGGSTLWMSSMFPYLCLPVSKGSRSSEILRGNIAQFFMKKRGLLLGFVANNLDRDVLREKDEGLDIKSNWSKDGMVEILQKMYSIIEDGNIEMLYLELYKHGILDYEDLTLSKIWIKTLEMDNFSYHSSAINTS